MLQAPPSLEALNAALTQRWPNHPRIVKIAPWRLAVDLSAVPVRCDPPTPGSEARYDASSRESCRAEELAGAGYNNYLLVSAGAREYRVYGLAYAMAGVVDTTHGAVLSFVADGRAT